MLHYWICQELGCKMKLCVLLSQFFSYFRKSYTLKMLEDYPEEITGNTIYIIGAYRQPQYAVFQCPCGCGRIVELNLNKESSPSWALKWHVLGTISFSPSIWRKDGCRSHFFSKKKFDTLVPVSNQVRESVVKGTKLCIRKECRTINSRNFPQVLHRNKQRKTL